MVLNNLVPHVHEVVVVDGGPEGPSTDASKAIIENFGEKVKYFSGTFATPHAAWDVGSQKNIALKAAAGDVVLFVSCDMYFAGLDVLMEAIAEQPDKLIFFTSLVEFWLNTKSMRLQSNDGNFLFSLPSAVVQLAAVDKSLVPTFDQAGGLRTKEALFESRVLVPQTVKFHAGWIRDFQQQVDKHIMHVKQGRWGDQGDRLVEVGERTLQQWAIRHVLAYPQTPSVDMMVKLPKEAAVLDNMQYNEGFGGVIDQYEEEYNVSVFK